MSIEKTEHVIYEFDTDEEANAIINLLDLIAESLDTQDAEDKMVVGIEIIDLLGDLGVIQVEGLDESDGE